MYACIPLGILSYVCMHTSFVHVSMRLSRIRRRLFSSSLSPTGCVHIPSMSASASSGAGGMPASTARPLALHSFEAVIERVDESPHCVVCCQMEGMAGDTFRGKRIHPACKNAVETFMLSISSDERLRALSDREFYNDIGAWRGRILPLLTGVPWPDDPRRIQDEMAYVTEEIVRDTLWLPLHRYIAYRTFWDRVSEREAERDFWAAVEVDGPNDDSDDEPTVAVRDNARCRTITGKRRHNYTTVLAATAPAASAARTPVRDRASANAGYARASEPGRKRHRQSSSSDFGGSFADDDDDDGASTSRPRATLGTSFRSGARSSSAHTLVMASSRRGGVDGTTPESSYLHMVHTRNSLVAEAKNCLTSTLAVDGVYNRLKERLEKLNGENAESLGNNPASILKDIGTQVVAPLQDMCFSMDALRPEEAEAAKAMGIWRMTHANRAHVPPQPPRVVRRRKVMEPIKSPSGRVGSRGWVRL